MENIIKENKAETPETEQLKKRILESIENAEKNPILIDRMIEIEKQLNILSEKAIERGCPLAEEMLEEDTLLAETIKSSAMSYNIVEFKELLNQLSTKFNLPKEWAEDLLAHENAHANVAIRQGAIWKGYGVIFMKDDSGQLVNLQPLNFIRSNPEWGPKETLNNSIESTEAPLKYGNALSEGDIEDIKKQKERLSRVIQKEQEEKERLDKITRLKEEINIETN